MDSSVVLATAKPRHSQEAQERRADEEMDHDVVEAAVAIKAEPAPSTKSGAKSRAVVTKPRSRVPRSGPTIVVCKTQCRYRACLLLTDKSVLSPLFTNTSDAVGFWPSGHWDEDWRQPTHVIGDFFIYWDVNAS